MVDEQDKRPKQDVDQTLQAQRGIKPGPGAGRGVCWLEERSRMISEAAYFRAERNGVAPGGDVNDWLQAEADTDRLIQAGGSRSAHSGRGT